MSSENIVLAPALCLDLDGTVRFPKSGKFINKPEDIVLFDDVIEKLWEYRSNGWVILGITNQGGIAYGIKTYEQEQEELKATRALFGDKDPFHPNMIKSCPFHPGGREEPYKHRSLFRKPGYGMLALCEVELFAEGIMIDWDRSLFVGDRPEDQQCAANADIAFQWAHEFFGRPAPSKDA